MRSISQKKNTISNVECGVRKFRLRSCAPAEGANRLLPVRLSSCINFGEGYSHLTACNEGALDAHTILISVTGNPRKHEGPKVPGRGRRRGRSVLRTLAQLWVGPGPPPPARRGSVRPGSARLQRPGWRGSPRPGRARLGGAAAQPPSRDHPSSDAAAAAAAIAPVEPRH